MAKQTGLSNLELAANSTWVIALTYCECPLCGYLTPAPGSLPCPKCNRSGSRRSVFPGYACIKWLKMIGDAYVRAYARTGEKQAELVEVIRSDFKRDIEPSWVAAAARSVRKLLRKSRGSNAEYRKVLDVLQKRLALENQEQAGRVFPMLWSYSETTNEHCNVVVSTAALFERLFSDLLVRLAGSRGSEWPDAKEIVAKTQRRVSRIRLFEKMTGTSLERSVREFGVRGLYAGWQDIARRRNLYLHVTPGAISAAMAERAFNLAKNAFGLFAFLHNKHCVTVTAGGADSAS